MPKRIIYFVQNYSPHDEAISKEVFMLSSYFKSRGFTITIHDLHLGSFFRFSIHKKLLSYHFIFYLFTFPLVYLMSRFSSLSHVYTSLGDMPYLSVLNKKNVLLTGASSSSFIKIRRRSWLLKKLRCLVVQSKQQKSELIRLGLKAPTINIIAPGVDLSQFSYKKPPKKSFTILFASSPPISSAFESRGIFFMLACASAFPHITFRWLWRGSCLSKVKRILSRSKLSNIILISKRIDDMNKEYGKVHCTIIPYKQYDQFNKFIPTSAIESLAAGKPILISEFTGLSDIVLKKKCGLIFSLDIDDFIKKVEFLRKNYSAYHARCGRVAEKYFSQHATLREYEHIYQNLMGKQR